MQKVGISVRTIRVSVCAVLLLVGLVAFTGVGSAADVVVDDGGDCANANATSIQAAVNAAMPGEVVEVCAGTYGESVVVNESVSLVANATGGDVVVEGNGSRSTGFGVADGTDDAVVRGFHVRNFTDAGVSAQGTNSNVTVANNTISGVDGRGISVATGTSGSQQNWTVSGNDVSVTSSGSNAIEVVAAGDATVASVDVRRNTVTAPTGIRVASTGSYAVTGVNVSGNNASDNILTGISLDSINNSSLKNNEIGGNSDGINIYSSDDNIVAKNTLSGDEIHIQNGKSNKIIDNTIAGDTHSLRLEGSKGTIVRNNTITSSKISGINISSSDKSVISSNQVSSEGAGIVLYKVTNSTVLRNNLPSYGSTGVLLESGASRNTIKNNNVTGDGEDGVVIYSSNLESSNNIIQNNTATGNVNGISLIYEPVTNNLIEDNNVSSNRNAGLSINQSDNNTLANNIAIGNGYSDYISKSGALNNSVENLTLSSANISFESRDVAISGASSPSETYPSGVGNGLLGGFVNATNTSADSYLALNVSYAQGDVTGLSESTLAAWRHDGTDWSRVAEPNGVDTTGNVVFANASAFGTFAPLGEYTTDLAFCRNISRAGRYTMVRNVTQTETANCFDVTSGDVVVDGDGHTLHGVSGADYDGITTEQVAGGPVDNVTVTDVRTVGFDRGVAIANADAATVRNVTADGRLRGVSIDSGSNHTVWNVTATGHGTAGVVLTGVNRSTVVGGDASSNPGDGVLVRDSDTVALRYVGAADNGRDGVRLDSSANVSVAGALAAGNARHGVAATGASDVLVRNSTVRANGADGVNATGSRNVELRASHVDNNTRSGVGVTDVTTVLVAGNAVLDSGGDGVRLQSSDGATVSGNEMTGSGGAGVAAPDAGNRTLVRNNVVANNSGSAGVHVVVRSDASNQTVADNRVRDNAGSGVRVDVAGGVTLAGLTVANNDVLRNADGVALATGTGGNLSATVRENAVVDNGAGGVALLDAGHGVDVDVLRNDLERNRDGVRVGADVPVAGVELGWNNVVDNDRYGVDNRNRTGGTWIDARDNWWGSADGPGTNLSATGIDGALADPVSGALADGGGDNVSAMGSTAPHNDTANVRFDAVLTERYGTGTPTGSTGSETADAGSGGGGGGGGGGGSGGGTTDERDDPDAVRVVSASLSDATVAAGETVTVTAVVGNDRQSPARFTATLSVDGERVDGRTVTVAARSEQTVTFTRQFDDDGRYAVDVDGVEAGTLVVGATPTAEPTATPRPTGTAEPTATATETSVATAPRDGEAEPLLLGAGLVVLLALLSAGYYVYRQPADPVGNPPGE